MAVTGEGIGDLPHRHPRCGGPCHSLGGSRHGVDRGQVDLSAIVIRVLERLGWASNVKWPTPAKLALRRIRIDS